MLSGGRGEIASGQALIDAAGALLLVLALTALLAPITRIGQGEAWADPYWATQYSIPQLVEKTGTQGVELVMWLAARGALGDKVTQVTRNYHIPISNTAAGLVVMETLD